MGGVYAPRVRNMRRTVSINDVVNQLILKYRGLFLLGFDIDLSYNEMLNLLAVLGLDMLHVLEGFELDREELYVDILSENKEAQDIFRGVSEGKVKLPMTIEDYFKIKKPKRGSIMIRKRKGRVK